MMKPQRPLMVAAAIGMAALLSSCTTPPAGPKISAAEPATGFAPYRMNQPAQVSVADNLQAYRHDAATHLYDRNSGRVYKGVLPPFLYAVAVLQVEVDSRGQLTALHWMREPLHAPEVVFEIERTIRQAAPFPAPQKLGRASYIETWLWDASGRFQLHTLTEGQSWAVTSLHLAAPATE